MDRAYEALSLATEETPRLLKDGIEGGDPRPEQATAETLYFLAKNRSHEATTRDQRRRAHGFTLGRRRCVARFVALVSLSADDIQKLLRGDAIVWDSLRAQIHVISELLSRHAIEGRLPPKQVAPTALAAMEKAQRHILSNAEPRIERMDELIGAVVQAVRDGIE